MTFIRRNELGVIGDGAGGSGEEFADLLVIGVRGSADRSDPAFTPFIVVISWVSIGQQTPLRPERHPGFKVSARAFVTSSPAICAELRMFL